ncbi:MAG: hypothetical protein QOF11_2575 [Chloroflexota bacterium]|jgi:hypothetical protein|nr:hypothetical protein [Chloroflexota bacterium]
MPSPVSALPPEAFLAAYPEPIQAIAGSLRALVRRTVPDAIERVRPGWRLIGYDLPVGRRSVFFAYVAPEPEHVHLGFEVGALMADPDGILEGAHLKLKKVRYLTFRPGQPIPEARLIALVREAARLASLSRQDRLAIELDRDWGPVAVVASTRGER